MAQIVSPNIWYPNGYPGAAYDLRKVEAWSIDTVDATKVNVRWISDPTPTTQFDKAAFEAAKQAAMNAGPGGGGPAGGDLTGSYPDPEVAGIRGYPVSTDVPVSGSTLIYDDVTGEWTVAPPIRYFASSADAVAAAPLINGSTIVISPGIPVGEAGTYQVVSNGGAAFPGDYFKVSTAVVVDTGVALTDPGALFPGSSNVSDALQALAGGAATVGAKTGAVLLVATTLDTAPVASPRSVEWQVKLSKGTNTYYCVINASSDGVSSADYSEYNIVPSPSSGTFDFTFSVDFSGGVRLQCTGSTLGWSYAVRRRSI